MATRTQGSEANAEGGVAPARRPKTGGRVKKSLDQLMSEARIRDELAGMNDDTVLPEQLAAIYLGISVAELAELRKPSKLGARGGARLKMIKPIREGAVGQNQKVFYKLGALREFHLASTVESSFEAAVNAGMYGFMTAQAPFFAQPEKRSDRGRITLVGKAWDRFDADWSQRIKDVLDGKLRAVWLAPSQAASSRWASSAAHKAFAKPWLAALKQERQSVKAAIDATEMSATAHERPAETIANSSMRRGGGI